MPASWKYVRVQYSPADAELAAAKVTGWAAMGGLGPEKGPGFTHGETVQFLTDLAVMRHSACVGVRGGRAAVYDDAGSFYGIGLVTGPRGISTPRTPKESQPRLIPIVGDEPLPPAGFSLPYDPKLDPGEGWPRELALGIDQLTRNIADAEQSSTVPAGWGVEPIPPPGEGMEGIPIAWPSLGVAAVIVGGLVATVVPAVAVYRFLDPTVRAQAARIRAAAKAYQQRLETFETTGQMPAAGTLETQNAEAVHELARPQENRYWLYGAAAVGGIALGALGISYLQRER